MEPRDLDAGVPLRDLPENVPVEGRLGDSRILLVRRDREVFAVGSQMHALRRAARRGLVSGQTVSCPWHHARFHLKTASRSARPRSRPCPAFASRYAAIARSFARSKKSHAPRAAAQESHPKSVVVVGAGAAGNAAAENAAPRGVWRPSHAHRRRARGPYDRPNLSKDYLAGSAPEDMIPLHAQSFYAEHAIELALGEGAARIDLAGRKVLGASGSTWNYDALVLAPGRPNRSFSDPGRYVAATCTCCGRSPTAAPSSSTLAPRVERS